MTQNKKYIIVNASEPTPAEMTVIVLGLGRSGTTIVASMLEYMGLFLGESPTGRTREDSRLSSAMESRDIDAVRQIINDYNTRYSVWAYKRPSAINFISEFIREFRNPRLIFCHRDLLGIAIRNEISIGRPIMQSFKNSIASYRKMLEVMRNLELPSLHISYDLLQYEKSSALNAINLFVNGEYLNKGDECKFDLFMKQKHKDYLG